MKHFGLTIKESKYGPLLTNKNYAIINRKSSLYNLADYLFTDKKYEMMPKEWVVLYLSKMRDYLMQLPKYKLQATHKKRLALVKSEIERYQTLNDDYHLFVLRSLYENEKKDQSYDKFINEQLTKIKAFVEPFDLEYDIMGRYYRQDWCEQLYENIMINLEYNMNFLSRLDEKEFNDSIDRFITINPGFKAIDDLTPYMNRSGYYLLVTDTYKQVYIGTASHIGERIRQHWNARKDFDRLLFPIDAVKTSKLSIDSYRALDITRIYVYETDVLFHHEEIYVKQFDKKFVANRILGGKIDVLNDMEDMGDEKNDKT